MVIIRFRVHIHLVDKTSIEREEGLGLLENFQEAES